MKESKAAGIAGAFWISPCGSVFPVAGTHIGEVIADPALFGLTAERIVSEYGREGEQVGTEGRARAAIVLELVGRGWIRIRRRPRSGSWTVNLSSDESGMERLRAWASMMVRSGASGADIVLVDMPGRAMECRLDRLSGAAPRGEAAVRDSLEAADVG